jgi:hypothetical protein
MEGGGKTKIQSISSIMNLIFQSPLFFIKYTPYTTILSPSFFLFVIKLHILFDFPYSVLPPGVAYQQKGVVRRGWHQWHQLTPSPIPTPGTASRSTLPHTVLSEVLLRDRQLQRHRASHSLLTPEQGHDSGKRFVFIAILSPLFSPHPLLFCFVLFCFVLFCFVLFCFVLFCSVLFCFVFVFVFF